SAWRIQHRGLGKELGRLLATLRPGAASGKWCSTGLSIYQVRCRSWVNTGAQCEQMFSALPRQGEERKSLPTFKMTAFDPDCVKTRASQERAELFSQ
ncbi:MAG TPA: hypothetical protein VNZ53_41675, partial [Steroidobacteraceae bacterium]|nr:hypothetical protein [Steroidobacteraceae bacterium]